MKASDAVSKKGVSSFGLVTAAPEDDLKSALKTMAKLKIHHLLVQEGDKVVGIVSDRGIVEKALMVDQGQLDQSKRVRDVMLKDFPKVDLDDDLSDVVNQMNDFEASAAVVYRKDIMVGLITEKDLLRQLADILGQDAESEITRLTKIFLSDPAVQRIMKTVSDVGI